MRMRRPSARMTPNTVQIRRVTFTKDRAAGRKHADGPPGPPIPCAVQPTTLEALPQHLRQESVNYFTVKVYDDPAVKLRDELTDERGRLLVVRGTRGPSGGAGRSWEVDCEHNPGPAGGS